MLKTIAFVGPLLDKLAGASGWLTGVLGSMSEAASSKKAEGKVTVLGWAGVAAGWFGINPEHLTAVGTFIANVGLGISHIAQSMGG